MAPSHDNAELLIDFVYSSIPGNLDVTDFIEHAYFVQALKVKRKLYNYNYVNI